ncbi:amidohydrolase family protein [Sphingomonas spermidinifaciens]|nr:amidohydrolase family protein [Sphingomonas spermidinifaciens]
MRIDAHHQLGRLARGDHGWLMPHAKVLHRDIPTADLEPHLAVRASTSRWWLRSLSEGSGKVGLEQLSSSLPVVVDTFACRRTLWGSEWPLPLGSASHADWPAVTDRLLSDLPEDHIAAIRGLNAARIHRIQRDLP